MEVMVTTAGTLKTQKNSSQITTNNIANNQFLHAGCPSSHPNDSDRTLKALLHHRIHYYAPAHTHYINKTELYEQ